MTHATIVIDQYVSVVHMPKKKGEKKMRKTRFAIDGYEGTFEGYTNGRIWNGFACPCFTKEVGMEICRANNEVNDATYHMWYDEKTDSFIRLDDMFEPEVFTGVDVDGMHLYPIGYACWIWDEYPSKMQWYDIVEEFIRKHYNLTEEDIETATEDIVGRCFAYGVPTIEELPEYIAVYMNR